MNKNTIPSYSPRPLIKVVVMILVITGCSQTKRTATTPLKPLPPATQKPAVTPIDANVMALLKELKSNELPFQELSARMKTKVSSPTLNQSFTTNIRWKKGEKIWLSMSIIGIEGARVLITKDSIKIMDKINSRYILKPLSYLKEKAYVDLSFADIENILLGQLVFTDTTKAKYANNATNTTISADGQRFLTSVVFDKKTNQLLSFFVSDKLFSRTIESAYDNYQEQAGKPFSMDRTLVMRSGMETFEMVAKFQSIEVRQNLEFPFTIYPNYTIEK
ncbi:MAG: DUF4292 domain-containing protein [Sphingobacteriales bacterium]|nr:DUF4292 domain-containing protein [Sphingobacteriales bacterium]